MPADDSQLPDLKVINRGLKDFQNRTARAAFRRLYQQKNSSHRFLVADEVGLGKTLIARSVIAQTLHQLWDKVDRIDIVYICSNADIARQNIKRLNVLGEEGKTLPTRITLLPIVIQDLNKSRINFISLTPSTSLDLKSNLGTAKERMLLYWLLKGPWRFAGMAPMNVFQGTSGAKKFRRELKSFAEYYQIDRASARQFKIALQEHSREAKAKGGWTLRRRFTWLCKAYQRSNARVSHEAWQERSAVVGELRNMLARTCVQMLEPDLIILDEFQRFKHLLNGKDDASVLARQLFEYAGDLNAVRVLLLSATPYKMYTLSDESGDEDHYRDFIDTLDFLFRSQKKVSRFANQLKEFRYELLRFNKQSPQKLEALKTDIQRALRKVMARTERLAVTDDRAGMLTQVEPEDVELLPGDLLAYVELQSIARELGMPNTIEYWKSSSYLLNFMEDYKLKQVFHDALEHGEKRKDLANRLTKARHLLLSWQEIEKYRALDPRNARLRGLIKQVIDTDMWQLLWLPPALSYYDLEGPFRNHSRTRLTKRLIFSSWRVVPKVVSTILSYEAERQAVKLFQPRAQNTEAARERRGHTLLLRIAVSKGRLSGMPVLALMYPSISMARRYDPLELARKHGNGAPLTLKQLQAIIGADIAQSLEAITTTTSESREDEQWYWAAPILLDLHHYPEATREWFDQYNLEHQWALEESRGEAAWVAHIDRAKKLLDGELILGRPPDDLAEVLTLFALGGPAICALRALDRFTDSSLASGVVARNAAGRIGWAFRSLFNRVEVTALLRGLKSTEPYWRRVLEYGSEGCLQAVLDEYVHVLKDSLGLVGETPEAMVEDIAEAIQVALTVRAAALAVDDIRSEDSGVTINTHRLPSRFAMPFGQGRDEESGDTGASRSQKVREAFNSPFWPFVVTSTSIGQEGLDFHWYCHAIVHWNLPSNPVDLEQREGRVHRYKGHAVRKNIATHYAPHALQSNDRDPWHGMLNAAVGARQPGENDLVPYWVYPIEDGARIERYVPSLPLTRDRQLLVALRQSLAVYRLVFGQPRQEDLVEYLQQHIPADQLDDLIGRLKIDLSP